ncbi:MAG: isochorismatase family protein [Bdellovibrio sp.]
MQKILCVIDIQKEYNTPDRPFYIQGIESSLNKALEVLNHARKNNWEVIHIKHLQPGNIFNPESDFSEFINEFKPVKGESVCMKDNFSSFSSPAFTKILENKQNAEIYVIGYGSTMCCLSTIIDGYHRGYNFTFVSDASNAKPTSNLTSEVLHKSATEILQAFCKIRKTQDILNS